MTTLKRGKISGEYYTNLLHILSDEIKKKTATFSEKESVFSPKQLPSRTSVVAMAEIKELKFDLLPYQPYLPDLAQSDFNLFPNLKKRLGGKRFTVINQVSDSVNSYFEGIDKSGYQSGITALEVMFSYSGLGVFTQDRRNILFGDKFE